MAETQMAMTPNFVWIATDDTESGEVIYTQHLLDNKLIMGDSELRPFINKIITGQ